MAAKLNRTTCTVDKRLCSDPACPAHTTLPSERKPPRSVCTLSELCSAFLAERGCLHRNDRVERRNEVAA